MIDCGEGAQLAFARARLKPQRLRHIFLTHLHGDHVLGLPGLLSTLSLSQTGGTITVHTFPEGVRILTGILDFFAGERSFNLEFNVIQPEDAVILDTPSLTVRTVRLNHRVPCVGFIFEENPKLRHIRSEMTDFHHVPVAQMRAIKEGADFVKPDGTVVPNAVLTTAADPQLSYAHIGDTKYMPQLASRIGPVDLLYHETTYTEEHAADAASRFHSTARQAAMTARDCGAKRLLTGHYSSRYKDDSVFSAEAMKIFPDVITGNEGMKICLD